MKPCKGFVSIDWLEDYCEKHKRSIFPLAGKSVFYIHKNNLIQRAEDYSVKNVPLSEFEAYKQKTKQVLNNWEKEIKSCPKKENCPPEVWDFTKDTLLNFIRELKKSLEL